MWWLQIRRSRVRFPHWNFFFHSFFSVPFCPLFFLHARSAISMLKHFSSTGGYEAVMNFSLLIGVAWGGLIFEGGYWLLGEAYFQGRPIF